MADQKISALPAATAAAAANEFAINEAGASKKLTGAQLKDFVLTTFVANEVPSGAINGTNAVFTLANTPSPADTLQLFLGGALQRPAGVDYTLSTNTITYVTAPLTGETHVCWYRK